MLPITGSQRPASFHGTSVLPDRPAGLAELTVPAPSFPETGSPGGVPSPGCFSGFPGAHSGAWRPMAATAAFWGVFYIKTRCRRANSGKRAPFM